MTERYPILLDLLLVIVFHTVSKYLCVNIHEEYGGSVSTLLTVAFLWWRLNVRSETFKNIGIYRPEKISKIVFAAIITILIVAIVINVVPILLLQLGFTSQTPNISRFTAIEGNVAMYLTWMSINLVTATSEEIIYRGFIISRLEKIIGRALPLLILILLIQAAYFGIRHYYQGTTQAFTAGSIGLIFGISYLVMKRNLWPAIAAHISLNALSLTERFIG